MLFACPDHGPDAESGKIYQTCLSDCLQVEEACMQVSATQQECVSGKDQSLKVASYNTYKCVPANEKDETSLDTTNTC